MHALDTAHLAARCDRTQGKAVQVSKQLPLGRMNEGITQEAEEPSAASCVFILGCTLTPTSKLACCQEVFLALVALQMGQDDPELSLGSLSQPQPRL